MSTFDNFLVLTLVSLKIGKYSDWSGCLVSFVGIALVFESIKFILFFNCWLFLSVSDGSVL